MKDHATIWKEILSKYSLNENVKKIQNHRTIYNQIHRQINWKEIFDFVISWNEKTLLSFEHLLLVPQIESQLALVLCEGNSY